MTSGVMRAQRVLFVSLGTLPLWSCSEAPTEPAAGGVLVAARTTGGDEDVDGYTVSVDGGPPTPLPPDGEVGFPDLMPGRHEVGLQGVAPNCDVAPSSELAFEVTAGGTALVLFLVECAATGLRIETTVEGVDDPLFYTVRLDGQARPEQVARGGSKDISGLAPGPHEVSLGNLPNNCSVTPAVHRVTVTLKAITPAPFGIRCVSTTGAVMVKVETTGEDQDLGGYVAIINEVLQVAVRSNATMVNGAVPPGEWEVRLTGIAPNCVPVGETRRIVSVTAGTVIRDTSQVVFAVACSRLWGLAFERGGRISLATADGGAFDLGPSGSSPAWAPDGGHLAYAGSCGGICIFDLQTGTERSIPWPDHIRGISWNPDGSRIVFASEHCVPYYYYYENCSLEALYTIRPDGTGGFRIGLPREVIGGGDPAWSPDGSTIVFGCIIAGAEGLCSVRPDGTAFTAIPGEGSHPSWSPDGSRLVFATTRFGGSELTTVKPDGTDLRRMDTPVPGASPAWSRDGTILFRGNHGLARVNADGTGFIQVTRNVDSNPAPRPPQ